MNLAVRLERNNILLFCSYFLFLRQPIYNGYEIVRKCFLNSLNKKKNTLVLKILNILEKSSGRVMAKWLVSLKPFNSK